MLRVRRSWKFAKSGRSIDIIQISQRCSLDLDVSVSRRSRDVVSKCLGLVSVSYHRVSFTSQCAQLFASLQNCTYIVLNAKRLYCLLIFQVYLLIAIQVHKWPRRHSCYNTAQRPPSPADRDLLSSNTANGGPTASAIPSNSKKLKLFDFMSTQPQRNKAPKKEQSVVSRDFQRLMSCSAVEL